MRGSVKALVACAALMAGLGVGAPAAAAASAPTLNTSGFVCSNGICQLGPGNVGVGFSVVLLAVGQCATQGGTTPEVTKVASGHLPPGLQFTNSGPGIGSAITGTPTRAGTYAFAVQLANVEGTGQICGPTGTQPLTITIGTGSSDRLIVQRAELRILCGDLPTMEFWASDANNGATFTVTQTSTGTPIHTFTGISETPAPGVLIRFPVPTPFARSFQGSITVTDTAGGSATAPVGKIVGC